MTDTCIELIVRKKSAFSGQMKEEKQNGMNVDKGKKTPERTFA